MVVRSIRIAETRVRFSLGPQVSTERVIIVKMTKKSRLHSFLTKIKNKINSLSDNQRYWLILILILIIAAAVRFYQLSQLPMGYNFDEAGMGYDAWCLANWRVSRNMMHLPVYLLNTGGGQSALYAYLTASWITIFGMSKFILRLTAALAGLVTIIFGSLIVKESLGKKAGLLAAFILAITPYFIMMSRLGFDCNLFLTTSTLALYLTIQAIKKQKCRYWLGAGFAWGISFYSYILSLVAVPIFIFLLVVYLLTLKKINWKQILALGLPMLALAWPLILLVIINYFDLLPIYSRFFYIPKLPIWRLGELTGETSFNFWQRLIVVPQTLFIIKPYDIEAFITSHGTLYWFAIPLTIGGFFLTFYQGIKNWCRRKFSITTLMSFWLMGQLIIAFTLSKVFHYRLNAIYFALIYGLVLFLFFLSKIIKKYWQKHGTTIFWTIILTTYCCAFVWFCRDYFVLQPQAGFPGGHFSDVFTEPLTAIDSWLKQSNLSIDDYQIYLDDKYVYYYLGTLTPPQEANLIGDQMREVFYHNYHFEWLPENGAPIDFVKDKIAPEDIYVIQTYNEAYIRKLLDYDFTPIYQNERYTVYVNEANFQASDEAQLN